jgi:hypothetical protein
MPSQAHGSDRRIAMRHPVDYRVLAARPGHGDVMLRIVNISTTGFMANSGCALAPGDRLTLRLPVIGEIEVQLAWRDSRRAGFHFERLVRLGDFTRMYVEMQPAANDHCFAALRQKSDHALL